MQLHEWFSCPCCESDTVGVLAYRPTLSLECYDCGHPRTVEFGEDVPAHDLVPTHVGADSEGPTSAPIVKEFRSIELRNPPGNVVSPSRNSCNRSQM